MVAEIRSEEDDTATTAEVAVKEQDRRAAAVEARLGWRVVYLHEGHSYSSGIQVQRLVNGKIVNVRPGDRLDWMMWLLLITPEEEWDDVWKKAGFAQ